MICPDCAHEFDSVWRWCPACGALLKPLVGYWSLGDDQYVVDWAPESRDDRPLVSPS
jgi:hypothetical protein